MSEPDINRLKLAFGVSIAQAIIDADNITEYEEFRLFGKIFPRNMLRAAGFVGDDDRFTEDLAVCWLEAREVLPEALSNDEKTDMLALFYGTALADDRLEEREMAVIRVATDILNISEAQLTALVDQLSQD